nr:MAG TPA: hypothetical protein [Caudoviricetes sp.]
MSRIKFILIRPKASIKYIKPVLGRLYAAYCWLMMINIKMYKLKVKNEKKKYYFIAIAIPKFRSG